MDSYGSSSSLPGTQLGVPDPLQPLGRWHLGAWALPATTLSLASAGVFALVWVVLQRSRELRALFVLPFPAGPLTAMAAAALAGWVAFRCRTRPGRLGPRLWALFLAGVASLATLGLLTEGLHPRHPWLHALAMAGLAAAFTLLPRFLKLRPDSWRVRYVTLLSLLVTLPILLSGALWVGHGVLARQDRRLTARVGELAREAAQVREASGYPWGRMADDPAAAGRKVAQLQALRVSPEDGEADLWRIAGVLGREAELERGTADLANALVQALDPARAPRVSSLQEPSLYWNPALRRWEESAAFPRLSVVVGGYHHEIGRLFAEIAAGLPAVATPASTRLATEVAARRSELSERLRDALSTWTDSWVVFEVPGHEAVARGDRKPLVEVLQAPLVPGDPGAPAPADLTRLTRMPLAEASELSRKAPGCRRRSFQEDDRAYVRLDCYAYAPRAEDSGAELDVELRLVYRSAPLGWLRDSDLPEEVFFLFLLPPAAPQQLFQQEAMAALAEGVKRREGVVIGYLDRSGAAADGFYWNAPDRSAVVVHRPQTSPLTPGKAALEVRVERRPGPSSTQAGPPPYRTPYRKGR